MDFVIADLHFGDRRVDGPRRRLLPGTDDIAAEIARRWNAVVTANDRVFVLGDIGASWLCAVRALQGEEHLIAGNADDLCQIARARVFASMAVARWYPGFLLTHIPVHPSQLRPGTVNVHGHLHAGKVQDHRYRCVSVEQTGFAPVRLSGLKGKPSQMRLL